MLSYSKILIAVFLIAGTGIVYFMLREPVTENSATENMPGKPKEYYQSLSLPVFRGDARFSGVAKGKLPLPLELKWRFKTGDAIKSSAVVAQGRVYVGSNDGRLYAVDIINGRQLWDFPANDTIEAPPMLMGNTVIVGSSDTWIYALAASDGKLRWKIKTKDKILGSANGFLHPKNGRPCVVVGSYDNTMYCLDIQNGNTVWTFESDNFINGAPAIYDNKAIFGGCDALIHIINLTDGSETGNITAEAYIAGSPGIEGSQAYIGNYDGAFMAADLKNRVLLWTYENDGEPFFSSPAVKGNCVIVGSRDMYLYCFQRDTGTVNWRFKASDDIDSSPVICDDKIIFGSSDGFLYIIDMKQGRQLWSFEVGSPITAAPAVVGGLIIVGAEDGVLYCFEGL